MLKRNRINFRLTDADYQLLKNEADKHRTTMSAILEVAVKTYFNPDTNAPLDAKVLRRMNGFDERQARIEQDQAATLEMLARYIFYWLTRSDPIPEGDRDAAHALGQRRYDFFMDQVTQHMTEARSSVADKKWDQ